MFIDHIFKFKLENVMFVFDYITCESDVFNFELSKPGSNLPLLSSSNLKLSSFNLSLSSSNLSLSALNFNINAGGLKLEAEISR